ncbi:MAG: hypothetical protein COW00_13625 [Bdellovibrio sp. CG12_big_fil_rev_8_21_14_0_65_39_13]|nr:MAG: hypothetical protein COW78_07050 [Bdellovibrio sp. CG22_combo_CG10-13_8_21_14_all_39_27]PIQ58655.1 MAG: hypothetical protein COW00_13625 [Bdellovibrio sp. CG12_big_fil_rev_8_21_14_0_65_39_13]PIR33030.1 MAG: hypothetical protein COV37_18220 [Bdellovibrio sp. CG11_big_fil_rev_8_21_14_0_20_39_38]
MLDNYDYITIFYKLLIRGRLISYTVKRHHDYSMIDDLIEIFEICHNLPLLIKNGSNEEIEMWLSLFNLNKYLND